MKTMKALVKKHAKPGLWLDQVPVPEIGVNDVLVKIRKTSICGTDIHIYDWDDWAERTQAGEGERSPGLRRAMR